MTDSDHRAQRQLPPWVELGPFRCEVDQDRMAREARNDMERLFYTHQGRRLHKWHHYLEVYDRHFRSFLASRRDRGEARPVRLLEIGVGGGGSLQMWRKYFGPEAVVFGIDFNPLCADVADPDVQVRIGSQTDAAFLSSVVDEMGGVDIVIDDGSHRASHQVASFDILFPRLSESGLYLCEDLQSSYMPRLEGGLRREGTFIELVKRMIDWLHDWYVNETDRKDGQYSDAYGFSTGVLGISVYDAIVVIEKRRKERPFNTVVGDQYFPGRR